MSNLQNLDLTIRSYRKIKNIQKNIPLKNIKFFVYDREKKIYLEIKTTSFNIESIKIIDIQKDSSLNNKFKKIKNK